MRTFRSSKDISKREKRNRVEKMQDLYPEYILKIHKIHEKKNSPQIVKRMPYTCKLWVVCSFLLPNPGFKQWALDHWHSLVAGLGNCLVPWFLLSCCVCGPLALPFTGLTSLSYLYGPRCFFLMNT